MTPLSNSLSSIETIMTKESHMQQLFKEIEVTHNLIAKSLTLILDGFINKISLFYLVCPFTSLKMTS